MLMLDVGKRMDKGIEGWWDLMRRMGDMRISVIRKMRKGRLSRKGIVK